MKNQYFGDVNDYRKYSLLRHLSASGFKRIVVAWMLTEDDGGPDGRFRTYLNGRSRLRLLDPQLHSALGRILQGAPQPAVTLLDGSRILPGSSFYSMMVPDQRDGRAVWRRGLLDAVTDADLVFVDPDNGIEIKAKPIGRKGSSKYVAWDELTAVWQTGCSLLVYQHFRRQERVAFARRLTGELGERVGATHVEAFRTPHVLFLLAAQERHLQSFRTASSTSPEWVGQIDAMGLANQRLQPSAAGAIMSRRG